MTLGPVFASDPFVDKYPEVGPRHFPYVGGFRMPSVGPSFPTKSHLEGPWGSNFWSMILPNISHSKSPRKYKHFKSSFQPPKKYSEPRVYNPPGVTSMRCIQKKSAHKFLSRPFDQKSMLFDGRYAVYVYIFTGYLYYPCWGSVKSTCYHVLQQRHPVQTEMALFCLSLT